MPGAGSPALRLRLHAAPATGVVVHAGDRAVYAHFPSAAPGTPAHVIGIVARDAVAVPCAVATALPTLPHVAVGARATLGAGVLQIAATAGPLVAGVDRLLATGAPTLPDPALASDRLAAALPDLAPVRRQLPPDALAALAAGDPAAVASLLGRGDGLTPVGDDVLAGWLVAARSAGRRTDAVAAAAAAGAHRTTDLSATLLADAADGAAIPQFRALLTAVAAGRGVAAAVTALLAVGHTSGAGMLLGAHLALAPVLSVSPPLEGSPR